MTKNAAKQIKETLLLLHQALAQYEVLLAYDQEPEHPIGFDFAYQELLKSLAYIEKEL